MDQNSRASVPALPYMIGLLAFFGGAAVSGAAEIKLALAGTPRQNVFAKIQRPYEKQSGDTLVFLGPPEGMSGDQAIRAVESGEAEGGALALAWDGIRDVIRDHHLPVKDIDRYKNRVIGSDRIQFYVNKANPVANLSEAQLRDIVAGKIDNWKMLGGADAPLELVLCPKNTSSNLLIQKKLLNGGEFKGRTKQVAELTNIRETVATNPGAIGFGGTGFINDTVRAPEQPVIGRPITFFTKDAPSPQVQKLLSFIQGEGRKYHVR